MKKLSIITVFVLVIVLTIGTNLIDRESFIKIDSATSEMYSDRLVALDIVYDFRKKITSKQHHLASQDYDLYLEKAKSDKIDLNTLEARYRETKLTIEEKKVFNQLIKDTKTLFQIESKAQQNLDSEVESEISTQLLLINDNLDQLNQVQLQEGKKLFNSSQRALGIANLLTSLEISLIILILVVSVILFLLDRKAKLEDKL